MKTWTACLLFAATSIAQAQIPADLQKAADQGDAENEYCLGIEYMRGEDVPKDYVKAMEWFKKEADNGNAHAEGGIGLLYFACLGVPKDYAQAMQWYWKAAKQGNAGRAGGGTHV